MGFYDTLLAKSLASGGGGGTDYLEKRLNNTLESYSSSNVTIVPSYAFTGCTSLKTVDFPNATEIRNNAFQQATSFETGLWPKVDTIGSYAFQGTAIEYAVFPTPVTSSAIMSVFHNCANLLAVDINIAAFSSASVFYKCQKMTTLILRKSDAITELSFYNAFLSTPFDSGGAGGTIYIPKALYDHLGDGTALDYKAASNWSTLDGNGTVTWAKIEGSTYETHYADGTAI